MNGHAIGLGLLCGLLFLFIAAIAVAANPDDSPPTDNEREYTRRHRDMHVVYYGRHAYPRSGRLGSVGNRSFRGGGLHGGK